MKKAIILKNTSDAKMLNALQESIKEAEGKARERKLNYHDIFYYLEKVEKKLDITKKAMEGVKVFCDPNAQEFPRAYKWTPESTQFTAEYKNGTWRITDIFRDDCGRHKISIKLTEEAEQAILNDYKVMF